MAVTRPEVPIVATVVTVLSQVPPALASVSVVVVPAHNEDRPETEDILFTVTGVCTLHPVAGMVKVILAIPVPIPVTIPELEPAVAIAGLLDDQVEVPEISLSVIVCPAQTDEGPVMFAGKALMVIVDIA